MLNVPRFPFPRSWPYNAWLCRASARACEIDKVVMEHKDNESGCFYRSSSCFFIVNSLCSRYERAYFCDVKHLFLFLLLLVSVRAAAQDDPSAWQTSYVIIAGESESYEQLDTQAAQLSKLTGIRYDNGGLIWSADKQLHLPENSDDEIYAGSYYMRRYDEDRISLEMRDWYFDVSPDKYSKKMIIVAGIFGDKKNANAQLKKIKKHFPASYIRTTRIYMGCIH